MIQFKSSQSINLNVKQIEATLAEIRSDSMGGWFDLPVSYDQPEVDAIKSAAQRIQRDSEFLVCIGIGGSYLGHRALIEALAQPSPVKVLYAGNSLSSRALAKIMQIIGDADFSINVISKSGTTTEPAIAFRFFKEKLQQKYGAKNVASRIYATTDGQRGALHDEAVQEGYTRFVVPDNIGGRYSVLTAVGLLPLAAAGADIDALLAGAREEKATFSKSSLAAVPAVQYSATRAELFRQHYDTEILASFEPDLQYFQEWWKQLFGESEGKDNQGIFPASVTYTTDLHSLGQYLQDGRRNIFETILKVTNPGEIDYRIPQLSGSDADGLQYLENRSLNEINQIVADAVITAHLSGGIPVLEITAPDLSERSLGALVYFFECACAISAKLCGVNPFDQPGVEAYKTGMFRLLGKPGF